MGRAGSVFGGENQGTKGLKSGIPAEPQSAVDFHPRAIEMVVAIRIVARHLHAEVPVVGARVQGPRSH